MALANPRETRAEIQRILEDFTRGSIDFQSLLAELDETFRSDPSARRVALELVDQLDPNGALQRGFFRVLKDRIAQNLATGAAIPLTSHPRAARAVDAVVQTRPFEQTTAPLGRMSGPVDPEPLAPEEAFDRDEAVNAAIAAGATVPLDALRQMAETAPAETIAARTTPPEPPVTAAPEPTQVPAPVASEPAPPPTTMQTPPPRAEPEPTPTQTPPPRAEAAPKPTMQTPPPRAPERAQPATPRDRAASAAPQARPFVTERRVITPPKPNPLAWIGGVIVIGLLIALILLGPLRDYLPQIKSFASAAQDEAVALFVTPKPARSPDAAPKSSESPTPPPAETTAPKPPAPVAESPPTPATTQGAPAAAPAADTAPANRVASVAPEAAPPATASSAANAESANAIPATNTPRAMPAPATPSKTAQPTSPSTAGSAATATAAPVAAAPAAPGRFTFAARSYRIREDGGMVALRIERRDGSAGAASVSWQTSPDSATPGEDYADFGPRVEEFANGEKTRVIYVPIAADDIAEEPETFDVQLSDPSAGATLGTTAAATVTITDDDP